MLHSIWLRFWRGYFRRMHALMRKHADLPPGVVWYSDVFPWLRSLERAAPRMLAELEQYVADGGVLPDKEELSPGRTLQYGSERWEFLHLVVYNEELEAITSRFPETMRALGQVPGCCGAMFSRLPANTKRILKHSDGANGTLRVHVPLKIPEGTCFMRIGGQDVDWSGGRAFALDATVAHEVFKDVEKERIILILDFLPPAPFWLRWFGQDLYPRISGQLAQRVLRESYSRLLTLR